MLAALESPACMPEHLTVCTGPTSGRITPGSGQSDPAVSGMPRVTPPHRQSHTHTRLTPFIQSQTHLPHQLQSLLSLLGLHYALPATSPAHTGNFRPAGTPHDYRAMAEQAEELYRQVKQSRAQLPVGHGGWSHSSLYHQPPHRMESSSVPPK